MMRKIILSKDAVLWESGDAARSFAVIESGKLGIRTAGDLAGVFWPGMVLGESAILALEGEPQRRSATVAALEEGTTVVEYPAALVQRLFDERSHAVPRAILMTLMGQICRSCLILMSAHPHNPFVSLPFKSLMQSLMSTYRPQIAAVQTWGDFLAAFRLLHGTRNYVEGMRAQLMVAEAHRDAILKASEVTRDFLKDQEDLRFLESFLAAEREATGGAA
jgi:hypothetical protein